MDKAAASALGLDFGTTNSVVALADGQGGTELVAFGDAGDAVFRSALCFWEEERGWNGIAHEAGPWAIEEYLQSPLDSRFIQSFKSVAASPLFERAMIFNKPFRFEDLGRLFLQRLIAHAGGALDARPQRIIVGRPVEYAGARPDPELARRRYDAMLAAQEAGRAAVRPGALAREVNAACRAPIEDAGLGEHFRHRMGHGIGLDVHERPFLSTEDETPLEAGLSYAVALGKPVDFIGRDALLRHRERGVAKRLVRLTLDDPAAYAWGGEPILMDGRRVSEVTSAGYSRRLGRAVAMGYAKAADPQATLTDEALRAARYQVDIAGTLYAARLQDETSR